MRFTQKKIFQLKSSLCVVWKSKVDFLRPTAGHFTAVNSSVQIILYPTENRSLAITGYIVLGNLFKLDGECSM